MKKSKQMKNIKESKEVKKVAQVVSLALFALCVDTSFAFGTYNHNITIRNQPSFGEIMERGAQRMHENNMLNQQLQMQQQMQRQNEMFQMLQQQQILNKQEHLQKLASDPEYALRDKLNQKSNALGRVMKESDEKLGTLNEKGKMLNEEFDLLRNEAKPLQDKTTSILARLDTLTEKEKALDTSKLLPQEKDEIKNFLSKAVELNTKRQAMNNKWQVYDDKASALNENFNKKATDFVNMLQKYSTEMEKYQHKIEYDNKAYEAFLNIAEKKVELFLNGSREKEAYILKQEKLYEEADKLVAEDIKFCKEVIKHKSFVRKYERFFKKVEKRLGGVGLANFLKNFAKQIIIT